MQRLAETTMSNPYLPTEILDHVVDHLHDTQDALRNCCLVSKSWIPRTRNHLFANVEFHTAEDLQSWKETFPDPTASPARYTKTLSVSCTAAPAEMDGWFTGFSRVARLEVDGYGRDFDFDFDFGFNESATPLVPFHGVSPIIKSLRVVIPALPSSQFFDLFLSFPLLEDLAVIVRHGTLADDDSGSEEDDMPAVTQSSSSPGLTGSLELDLLGGMGPFTRRLLSLPGSIHFRELILTWYHDEDLSMTTALVKGCSHTLEALNIAYRLHGTSVRHLCPHR
jgi:hypothetical protein